MKKILFSSLVAIAFLSGCATSSNQSAKSEKSMTIDVKTIEFVGEKDKNYKVKLVSHDNFETAALSDNKGNMYKVKSAVSGSGVRLANDEGVQIHFSKGKGILNLGHGKENIFLDYVQ